MSGVSLVVAVMTAGFCLVMMTATPNLEHKGFKYNMIAMLSRWGFYCQYKINEWVNASN